MTACGPMIAATMPPAMTSEMARGRKAGLAVSAAAKRNCCTKAAEKPTRNAPAQRRRKLAVTIASAEAAAPSRADQHAGDEAAAPADPAHQQAAGTVPQAVPTTKAVIGSGRERLVLAEHVVGGKRRRREDDRRHRAGERAGGGEHKDIAPRLAVVGDRRPAALGHRFRLVRSVHVGAPRRAASGRPSSSTSVGSPRLRLRLPMRATGTPAFRRRGTKAGLVAAAGPRPGSRSRRRPSEAAPGVRSSTDAEAVGQRHAAPPRSSAEQPEAADELVAIADEPVGDVHRGGSEFEQRRRQRYARLGHAIAPRPERRARASRQARPRDRARSSAAPGPPPPRRSSPET